MRIFLGITQIIFRLRIVQIFFKFLQTFFISRNIFLVSFLHFFKDSNKKKSNFHGCPIVKFLFFVFRCTPWVGGVDQRFNYLACPKTGCVNHIRFKIFLKSFTTIVQICQLVSYVLDSDGRVRVRESTSTSTFFLI